jgi:hypothetical protein
MIDVVLKRFETPDEVRTFREGSVRGRPDRPRAHRSGNV